MNRPMKELAYKTHVYLECPLPDGRTRNVLAPDHDSYSGECDECERYYREEIHADFCDETCPQRYEDIDGGLDLGRCRGCTCEHCDSETNSYEEGEVANGS